METIVARKATETAFFDEMYRTGGTTRSRNFFNIGRGKVQYRKRVQSLVTTGHVLEYGCGPGSVAFSLVERGATAVGIDISPVAIEQANAQIPPTHRDRLRFRVMDAENLEFDDDTFDLICGTGILHHLDLEKAYFEVARTLKPTGTAVFYEPLGHNPALNLYRKLTPNSHTPDEHPLLMSDLAMAEAYFDGVEVEYSAFFSLLSIPFLPLESSTPLLHGLEAIDDAAFRLVPSLRKQAGIVLLIFSSPR